MRKRFFWATATFALISAVNAAEPKLLTIEGGPFQIAPEFPLAALRIPVTPSAELKEKLVISVANVHFRNRSDAVLLAAFRDISWEDDKLEAIVMKVDTKVINEKGSYELILAFRSADPNSAFKPERIKTTVTVPEARLRAVEKLIIKRVWNFINWSEDTIIPLALEETSNAAFLTNVKVRPSRIATFANRQVNGQLDFLNPGDGRALDSATLMIPPGGLLTLDYKLGGDFPLGVVTGALEVNAPQLAAPLAVPFEVSSRLCRGYIFLFLALGLTISYLVKVRLQRAIDLGEARQQGAGVLERVQTELARRKDQKFKSALSQQIETFEALLKGEDSAPLSAASKQLDDLLRSELADLAKRHEEMQVKVDEFRLITENDWPLPVSLAAAIAEAKKKVDAAADDLRSDAIEDAQGKLETTRAELTKSLMDELPAWQSAVKNLLEHLTKATLGISATVQAEFIKHAEPAKAALGAAKFDDAAAKASAIRTLLPEVVKERRLALDPLLWLAQAMQAEANQTELLKKFNLPDASAIDNLKKKVGDFSEFLSGAADRPKGATETLPTTLGDIQAGWVNALTTQVPNAAPAVGQLVEERKYSDAASAVLKLLRDAQPANKVLGGGPFQFASHFPQWMTGADLLPPIISFRSGSAFGPEPGPLAALKLRSAWETKRAKFWQTVIIGLLVALLGYITYQDKFVGDLTDFATIFFWAFGIDVSVDTLLKLAPKRS
jgi:hypothetical protein